MNNLESEIKKYDMLFLMVVRGSGGSRQQRCLWNICGKPMIQWVLEAVKGSKYPQKIVVCTEDRKIKDVVENLGFQVIDRPLQTALDPLEAFSTARRRVAKPRSLVYDTGFERFPTVREYVLYCLEKLESYVPDMVNWCSAQAPLITSKSIDRIIEKFFETPGAIASVGIYNMNEHSAFIINPKTDCIFPVFYDGFEFSSRELYPQLINQAGFSVYGCAEKRSVEARRHAWVLVKPEEGLTVHNEEDLFLARCYMKRRLEGERWL